MWIRVGAERALAHPASHHLCPPATANEPPGGASLPDSFLDGDWSFLKAPTETSASHVRDTSLSSDEGSGWLLRSSAPSSICACRRAVARAGSLSNAVRAGEADRIYEFGSVPLKVSVSVPRRPYGALLLLEKPGRYGSRISHQVGRVLLRLATSSAVDAASPLSAKTFAFSQKDCSTVLYRVFQLSRLFAVG